MSHEGPSTQPDVIDRLIDGERVDALTTEDMEAVWRWVQDPRVGLEPRMRRLITLLLYELRKTAGDVPPHRGATWDPT